MRYDVHMRAGIKERLGKLAEQMREWEAMPRLDDQARQHILQAIQPFGHTTATESFRIAGVDGSGDFPAVAYADSFVYMTVAHGTVYESAAVSGLREVPASGEPIVEFVWIPEEEQQRRQAWDSAFAALAGQDPLLVVQQSDYRALKTKGSGKQTTAQDLVEQLIRPHAADSANVAIQLRSTGELGAAMRILQAGMNIRYLLLDGTLSLPLVTRKDISLFYEHLKRQCCVEARSCNVGLFAVSKSHGLPDILALEDLARQKLGLAERQVAEHWYLRLPVPGVDNWKFALAEGRQLPPLGAVTYLFRLHRNVPVLRLDMDLEYWRSHVWREDPSAVVANEQRIFQDLDYASHDQRCYGYPYPIKAGHDRASLTQAERVALRKQIIDSAVQAGLRRSLFRDASAATGHE